MNKQYNVVIIDDEEIGISNLSRSLSDFSEILIAGTTQSAQTGKDLILEKRPDLLFLDVEMPETSGLELLHEIKNLINWQMQVVFYTAYEKYMLEALRESAFDYLLKPYEQNEFQTVMNRFFDSADKEDKLSSFIDSLSQLIPENRTFLIATITGYITLRQEQIGYFEYAKENKHWYITLQNGKHIQLKRNTKAEDIIKLSKSFAQINQQQIINIDYLAMIEGKRCVLYPPYEEKADLIISRSFLKSVQDKFNLI
nr:response regulator [uncultured Bacteroides sp.]